MPSSTKLQIVCLGASTVYGVGSTKGGWPDRLKQELHQKMYGPNGIGEQYEVYNIGVPGSGLGRLLKMTETNLASIHKPDRKLIAIIHGGANNALAKSTPDNFVSTPEKFREELGNFLTMVQRLSDNILCFGMLPMNQAKVMPIISNNPAADKIYFPNERLKAFEDIVAQVTQSLSISFVPLFDEGMSIGWTDKYQYSDGIHPNDQGHEWLYRKVRDSLQRIAVF